MKGANEELSGEEAWGAYMDGLQSSTEDRSVRETVVGILLER